MRIEERVKKMTEEIKEEPISLDIQQIMNILPHRYPFLLVDRITEWLNALLLFC